MTATREIEDIVRQAQSAQAALRQARLRLAGAARPGAPPSVFLDPSWDWARRILTTRAPHLRAFPGVVGYALGEKLHAGVPSGEPCLTVYVRRKLDDAELRARAWRRLPARLGTGPRSIAIDVVELGDLERHASKATARAHGLDATSDALRAATVLMGRLVTGEPVDVPGLGVLRGWRPVIFPSDVGVAVRLAGLVSGLQHGVLAHPHACLPGWGFDGALLAHVHSVPGDSGSVLVDPENLVLGFLVGRATSPHVALRVARPAASLVNAPAASAARDESHGDAT